MDARDLNGSEHYTGVTLLDWTWSEVGEASKGE